MKRVVVTLFLAVLLMMPSALLFSTNIQSKSVTITQIRDYTPSQHQISSRIEIFNEADFIEAGATGAGTIEDPYVLGNLSISIGSGTCIYVRDTTVYFIISNCILETGNTGLGIQFANVQNGQVELCEISGGSSGIIFVDSDYCKISNISIYDCSNGIHLYSTSNCSTIYSRLFNNHRGLRIEDSRYAKVVNNSIYSNTLNGVDLDFFSHNNTIFGNSIGWNGFSNNAVDDGFDNHFDDGVSLGNAWADFNGSIPYMISGANRSVDSYPQLLEDTEGPVLFSLLDTAIDVESFGNALIWSAYDEYPNTYSIRVDDGPWASNPWTGEDITINLDTLQMGLHRFNLTLYDGAGNTASDEVLVSVVSFILGGIGTELVMIASGITLACFIVIILIIKKLS